MNLRDIKKDIDYVLSAFIEDCTVCAAVNPKSDDKVIAGLMEDAVVTVKVEGSKKSYFNNLRKEILERTDALYTKLSEAVAKGAKAEPEAEKKPAAKKAPAKKAPAKKAEAAEAAPEAEKKAPAKKPAAKKPAAKKAEPKAE